MADTIRELRRDDISSSPLRWYLVANIAYAGYHSAQKVLNWELPKQKPSTTEHDAEEQPPIYRYAKPIGLLLAGSANIALSLPTSITGINYWDYKNPSFLDIALNGHIEAILLWNAGTTLENAAATLERD